MLNDGAFIDLVPRLRTMSRILDILVSESPSSMSKEVVETALEAIRRRDLAEASMLLEEEVRADPFWLRGYLFLATIYEYEQRTEPAIATIACSERKDGARRWSGSTARSCTIVFGIPPNG
jgi:hypothetical protein